MRMRTHQFVLRTLVLALVAALVLATPTPTQVSSAPIGNSILARAVEIELGLTEPCDKEQLVSSGAVYAALLATGELDRRASASGKDPSKAFSRHGTQGCSNRFEGGGQGGSNVRVNQDCSLRRQAEEVIVVNPLDDDNLIAGQNDSRLGFNHCGYAWSFDGGKTWGDQTPPFWQFQLLDGHTSDACSDPSATFDSKGNAYITGIIFDVASAANAIVVAKSNAPIGGAFYHSPAVQPFQTYRDVPLGVVANDNDPAILHDKEFIVADASSGSPKKDNVYVTWTRFTTTHSPIYFSQSTNGGATWSAGVEIDGVNASICTFPTAGGGACNDNQGSHPIVGPDGTLYVIFGNANTPLPGINQVAMVKCPAAANCASSASWSAPVKINDLIGTHPRQTGGANPITGCPNGRRCLPPNGYRVPEFTSISLSIDGSGKLYRSEERRVGKECS